MLNSTWARWVAGDPGYNPNLSLAHESFPLAWPPRNPLPTSGVDGECTPVKETPPGVSGSGRRA